MKFKCIFDFFINISTYPRFIEDINKTVILLISSFKISLKNSSLDNLTLIVIINKNNIFDKIKNN